MHKEALNTFLGEDQAYQDNSHPTKSSQGPEGKKMELRDSGQ